MTLLDCPAVEIINTKDLKNFFFDSFSRPAAKQFYNPILGYYNTDCSIIIEPSFDKATLEFAHGSAERNSLRKIRHRATVLISVFLSVNSTTLFSKSSKEYVFHLKYERAEFETVFNLIEEYNIEKTNL